MIRLSTAIIVLGFLIGGLFSYADADSGVGITPGKIEVNDELKPGGRYVLPSISVINTGNDRQQYEVLVSYLAEQEGRRVPGKWLTIEPQRFDLEPGKAQRVDFEVSLPGSAEPGPYFALLEAQSVPVSGQSFQPSVASKLTFSIGESGWLETKKRQINNLADDSSPWFYLVPLGAAAACILRWSSRRVRFRLPFEPR